MAAKRRTGIFLLDELPAVAARLQSDSQRSEPSDEELVDRLASDCFICQTSLTKANDSNEDVFPQWLQKRFRLKDEMINLLNGEGVRYADALVPCCRRCNNDYMSPIEDRVARAFKHGYPAFARLSQSDLYLWTAKIFYGLLHLEVSPRHWKQKHLLPPTLPEQTLDGLRLIRLLLDGFRKAVIVSAPQRPFSTLSFPLKSSANLKLQFHYRDSIDWPMALALRLGTIGLLTVFDDFGTIGSWYEDNLSRLLSGRMLHPQQFAELVARIFYNCSLAGFNVSYSSVQSENELLLWTTPYSTTGLAPDSYRLACMIAEYSGVSLETLWNLNQRQVCSTLVRPDGTFLDLPIEENIY